MTIKKNDTILHLEQKMEELQEEVKTLTQNLVAEYVKAIVHTYAIDFKENDAEFPSAVALTFEDVYNDEGGTDLYVDHVHFYDKVGGRLYVDFEVENGRYEEEFAYVVREFLQDKFDPEDLQRYVGESRIQLH